MISINATLLVQVLHILILILILNRILLRPIMKLINDRARHFDDTKDSIQELEQETERLKDRFLSLQHDARKTASQERTDLKDAGISEAEGFLAESKKTVTAIRTDADKAAEEEMEKTRPMLQGEAEALADEIVFRIVDRRISS